MRLAALALLFTTPAIASPRALPAPPPVRALEATARSGGRLSAVGVPSLAAPHKLLVVGHELWIAADAGVGRVGTELRGEAPRLVRDADGAAIGATNDLAEVGGEIWAATERGVVRIDARSGAVLGRVLADRHVLAVDDGAAATDRGIFDVRRGELLDPRTDVHALAHCGGGRFALADGRVRKIGARSVPVEGNAMSLGCAGRALVIGTDAGAPGWGADQAITAIASVGDTVALGTLDGLRFARRRGEAPRFSAPGRVWAVAGDARGWWVAMGDALLRLRPDGELACSMELTGPRGLVTAIEPEGDAAWVGTFDDGLYRLEGGRYRREPTPDARITALLRDHGRLLIGTAAGLFERRDGGAIERVRDPLGRFERHISALRRLGEDVLVGAYPGAVLLGTKDAARYLTGRVMTAGPGEQAIFATTVFGAARVGDALWLATQDGLERIEHGAASLIASIGGVLPDDWVNDVARVGDDTFFLLADRGVGWVGPQGTTIVAAHLPSAGGSLRVLGARALFAGDGALVVAAPRERAILTRYDAAQGVDLVVTALAIDEAADRLWVGGLGGVLRIDDVRAQLGGER